MLKSLTMSVMLAASLFLAACKPHPIEKKAEPVPPIAERKDKTITQLGRTRTDPWAWLKDENWQKVMQAPDSLQADIKAYLVSENTYQEQLLAETTGLQEQIFQELKGRIKEDDSTVPTRDGGFSYWRKFETGAQYPRVLRAPVNAAGEVSGPEQILFDGVKEAGGRAFFDFAGLSYAPDHRIGAWAFDDKGSEFYTIRFRNLETASDFGEEIPHSQGDFVWANDSKTLFWVWRDDNSRPSKVFRHVLGTDPKTDVLVYEEKDPGLFLGLGKTASEKFIEIVSANQVSSEIRLIDADNPASAPRLFAAREGQLLYEIEDWDGGFLVLTNADNAPDFKLMTAARGATARKDWKEFIPARPGVMIDGIWPYKDYLVRLERENALKRLIVRARADGAEHAIVFEDSAYNLAGQGAAEYDSANFRFTYSSPRQPAQTFDYDLAKRSRVLRKTQEIPSGHDPALYVVERIETTAKDGTKIPVTLLRKKTTPLDGTAPVLLYGYGSYSIPSDPAYGNRPYPLVNRGWIWAVAHVRGGGDKGRSWYLDGKLDKKINTFTDFVAVGEDLVTRNYAKKGRIVIYGGSAGGLLVGAAANLAPELWGGVIGQVPFVDALNTMSDESLPLTPPEWPEWGNPLTDEKAYDWIAAYSPYDNVADRAYPPILAVGGVTDPRVTYWEPAKWIAKLRHEAPKGGPYVLKINLGAGHGGATGRFDSLRDDALDLTFAVWAIERGRADVAKKPKG